MDFTFEPVEAPRVLVTRPAEDAPPLANALARVGFEPVVVPLLQRIWHTEAVFEAATAHPRADWIIITSATAAAVVATAAPAVWTHARWAAVGPTTASRLQQLGYSVDLVPERATAAHLVEALGDLTDQCVVYPRADLASPTTAEALRRAGAQVVDVIAYANLAPRGFEARLRRTLPVAATTLLSGSAARRLAQAVPPQDHSSLGQVVCIGPSTAAVATEHGLSVHAVADPHSLAGLLSALERVLT